MLLLECLLERQLKRPIEGTFSEHLGYRSARSKRLGEALCRFPQGLGIHDAENESYLLRFHSTDDAAAQNEFLRSLETDQARQQPGASKVNSQSAPHEDLGEPRSIRGDDNVTSERKIHPGTGRHTVNRSNRRLGQSVKSERSRSNLLHSRRPYIHRLHTSVLRTEIGARAELTASARNDQRPLRGPLEVGERRGEFFPAAGGDRVHVFRMIQGEPTDGPVVDGFNEHRASLLGICIRVPLTAPVPDTMDAYMGFNPFREQRSTAFDIGLVIVALAATAGVIIWAIAG